MPALAKLISTIEGTDAKATVDRHLGEMDDRFERLSVGFDGEAQGPTLNLVLRDRQGTLPATALGDGARRIIQFATVIPLAQGGFTLIDEIESGIHFQQLEECVV